MSRARHAPCGRRTRRISPLIAGFSGTTTFHVANFSLTTYRRNMLLRHPRHPLRLESAQERLRGELVHGLADQGDGRPGSEATGPGRHGLGPVARPGIVRVRAIGRVRCDGLSADRCLAEVGRNFRREQRAGVLLEIGVERATNLIHPPCEWTCARRGPTRRGESQ